MKKINSIDEFFEESEISREAFWQFVKNQLIQRRINYSVTQFCNAFNISKPTFYELIKQGHLQTYKIGNRRMVSGNAALEFQKRMEAEENAA